MRAINVMPHGPAYAYAPGARPDVAWPMPDGAWVGFWPREWPDLLGESVLRLVDGLAWEVWQPDVRADRLYAETLPSGVTHRLFPATERSYGPSLMAMHGVYSEALLRQVEALDPVGDVLVLHGFRVPLFGELLRRLRRHPACRVMIISHGMSTAPITEMRALHRPVTYCRLLMEQRALAATLRRANLITVPSAYARGQVRTLYGGRIEPLTMGCDFDFWRPVPSETVQRETRARLGLPADRIILLSTGNFVPFKRFERLIGSCASMQDRHDLFLLIAGHGTPVATQALQRAMAPLAERGAGMVHPYVTGEALRDLYWAADVYVSRSISEGSSVSVMKAMACGLPVVTPPIGETAERMAREGGELLVPADSDEAWRRAIRAILDGVRPAPFDRARARAAYDWPHVAARFVELVRGVRPHTLHDPVVAAAS